jgi:4-hydroxybenzoate polyprenyltransferase
MTENAPHNPKKAGLSAYARLMRLHQPVGIWLLFWPCAWALTLASEDMPHWYVMAMFAIGAVLMRGAGCIINDMVDRDFDKHVERTKNRPLASGELNMKQASLLLAVTLLLSLLVATELGMAVVLWASLSLFPIAVYPFMKRVSWWPQFFLGLTFNWGALMGWVAVNGAIDLPALLLYAGGVFWTLGYDTIYAHQDTADDMRIGVRSSALKLGDRTGEFVTVMYVLAVLHWGVAGLTAGLGAVFLLLLVPVAAHFVWQLRRLDIYNRPLARRIFLSNAWLGALVYMAILLAKWLA